MKKRRLAICLAILVAVVCGFWVHSLARQIESIVLTEEQVQDAVNSHLPIQTMDLKITYVDVSFQENNIDIEIDSTGKIWTYAVIASVQTRGQLVFDNATGVFYFRPENLKISDLQIDDLPVAERVGRFGELFANSKYLKQQKEVLGQKVQDWATTAAEKTALWALQRIPIYKVAGTLQGTIFRTAFRSLEVHEGKIILHFSFWQLTAGAFAALAGFICFLILFVLFASVFVYFPYV